MNLTSPTPTMSSIEIAELCDKRHDHVMRDIREMLVQLYGESGLPNFGASYTNSQNKPQPCFNLPKRETMVLVSGYSIVLRAKIIDRWQELESAAAPAKIDATALLEDPAALRGLLLGYADKVQHLQAEVATLAPKGEAYDRLLSSDGVFPLQHIGRALLCHPNLFISEVLVPKYCFREGTRIIARQDFVKMGLFENKAWPAPNGKVLFHAKAKAKALTYFAAVDIPTHVRNPDQVKKTSVPALSAAATAH